MVKAVGPWEQEEGSATVTPDYGMCNLGGMGVPVLPTPPLPNTVSLYSVFALNAMLGEKMET